MVSPVTNPVNLKNLEEIEKNLKSGVRNNPKNQTGFNSTIGMLFPQKIETNNPNNNNNINYQQNTHPFNFSTIKNQFTNTKNTSIINNPALLTQNSLEHQNTTNLQAEALAKSKNCPFDYATLFLLKNSLNYIYDMYLTLNTFNCLRMSKMNKRLTNLNFEYFVNYMINYFYPISKIKNFKIELKSDLEGEVYAIYDYYRVIFFNVIIFILNNTRDSKKEKTLTISVKHHIFTENQGSYYKAIFSFVDESPYIPYNLLNEVLQSLKNTELNSITLEKYKLIDFGLLVSFYIANTVYNSEFTINTLPNTDNHMIVVNILASNTKESNQQGNIQLTQASMQNTIRSMVVTKVFKKPKTAIEEIYYNKILAKLYKENKTNGVLETTLNNQGIKNNQEKLKKTVIKRTTTSLAGTKKIGGLNSKDIMNKLDKKGLQKEELFDDGSNDACRIYFKLIFYYYSYLK